MRIQVSDREQKILAAYLAVLAICLLWMCWSRLVSVDAKLHRLNQKVPGDGGVGPRLALEDSHVDYPGDRGDGIGGGQGDDVDDFDEDFGEGSG